MVHFSRKSWSSIDGAPEVIMLFQLSNLALVAWIYSKLQVEAFLITVGPAVRPKCLVGHASRWISTVSTKRTSTVGAGYPRLRVSTGENTVELPMGTSSNQKEGKQALDALIEQFLSPENDNMTATVEEYLDLCDHAFLTHLRGRTAMAEGTQPSTANALRQVEEEINMAMQRRLAAADINLRCVLDLAPDVKRMEGKLRALFSEGKVDMAFMVMINMNLARAKEAQVSEEATKLLTHLTTFVMELQDKRLNPELKLLRSLLRTDCDGVRKSMLKEHLKLPNYDIFSESRLDKNKVEPDLLQKAIADMATQIEELGELADTGLMVILQRLQNEIDDVVKGSQRPGPFRK